MTSCFLMTQPLFSVPAARLSGEPQCHAAVRAQAVVITSAIEGNYEQKNVCKKGPEAPD